MCYRFTPDGANVAGKRERIFKVTFHNQGKVYELFASSVGQGDLLGFVEVEGLLFGERSALIIDATEEGLRTEFEGVRRLWVPMHAVVRIDEVEKVGTPRTLAPDGPGGQMSVLPMPVSSRPSRTPKS